MKILTNKEYEKMKNYEQFLLSEIKIKNFLIETYQEELENTVNNAYAFNHLHELELIKCFEEQQ